MATYRLRQPIKDAPVRRIIHDVVTQHLTWGKRLVYGWMRERGYDYSACTVYRVYRRSGYTAKWRTRSRTIWRGIRINPTAVQPHEVWCMDVAEDRLMTGQKMMALLVKDKATSFGLSITLRRSFKGLDVEAVHNELVA